MSLSTSATTNGTGERKNIHEIVERDAKQMPVASTASVAAKVLVALPIWMALILPITIAYQAGKSILGLVRKSSDDQAAAPETTTSSEASITVTPDDIIPRPDRKHDVVVLGATGFTGGLAVRHLAKTYGTGNG